MQAADFLYENPPLVEVIAEVHWELQPLTAVPLGGVDPFFKKSLKKLLDELAKSGFDTVERPVPDDAPLELFANKPVMRVRSAKSKWPLFQYGPGIYVCNVTPPYQGWADYRQTFRIGLDALLRAYPQPSEFMTISRLELRYLDAFKRVHGFDNYSDFLLKAFKISPLLSMNFMENAVKDGPKSVVSVIETRFPCSNMESTEAIFRFSPGKISDEDAVILQISCRRNEAGIAPTETTIVPWFDAAHSEVRMFFETIISEETKSTFGGKRSI